MVDDFIERKWGRKEVRYDLPELKELLEETYGVIVYQEQVMQISNRSPATRWAMPICCAAPWAKRSSRRWKSSASASSPERPPSGHPQKKVEKIFDLMEQFAGYGLISPTPRPTPIWPSSRVPESALSGRFHGRAAHFGNRQHRESREVHQRMPRNGHRDSAARCESQRVELHARRQRRRADAAYGSAWGR
jgi:hypothetical protein